MKFRIPELRWLIALALFTASLLNYVDRNVLGLPATTIQKDLKISNQDYAGIINYFLIAYTLANLMSGRVVDKLGPRVSLAMFVGWRTIANGLTGLARSLWQLCALRFLLGLGEAGCYTASPKTVCEWFPATERSVAVGIYSSAGAVGATLAPLMVAVIAGADGHRGRWVFVVTPVVATVWVFCWLWLYKKPGHHPNIATKEKSHPAANLTHSAAAPLPEKSELALWGRVLREPLVWLLVLARPITDPAWYFFQFWFPKYLRDERGVDQKGVAIMWMIFAAATLGFVFGGCLSGWLVKQGCLPSAARLWVLLTSACLTPLMAVVPFAPRATMTVVIAMVVAYGATAWLVNITSLVVDLVPQDFLATAFGVIAFGSTLGTFFMNNTVAWLIDHRGYHDCFYGMAVLYPAALLLVWRLREESKAN